MNLRKRDLKYFELAKRISKKSDHHRHHLGCVIVKKGKILSIGFNSVKTHPKATNKFNMLHCEVHAILGLSVYELKDADVYVYRENTQGLALAKPCPSCMSMLCDCDIKRIYYTIYGGYDCLTIG